MSTAGLSSDVELLNPLTLAVHYGVLLASLILPPFPHRAKIFAPLLVLTYIPTILRPASTDPAIAYAITTFWVYTLRVLGLLLFTAPEHGFYRPAQESAQAAVAYPFFRKAGWVLSLLATPRGVGWNVAQHFARPPGWQSRGAYVVRALIRTAATLLLVDLARIWSVRQPFTRALSDPEFMFPTDSRRPCWRLVVDVVANSIQGGGFMDMQYMLMSVLAVGVFGSETTQWPRLFGSLSDFYSVGRLWGSECFFLSFLTG